MMKLDELIRTGLSRVDTIAVKRTALNSALWIVGLITPLALVLTTIVGDQFRQLIYFCFAAGPVLFAMVVYLVWMFRDPDRLQSEEYRVRLQELRLRYRKGRKPVVIDPTNEMGRIEQDHGGTHENPSSGV